MNSIQELLKLPELTKTRTSERAESIRPFVGRVSNRKGKLTAKQLGVVLSKVKSCSDLYVLFRECESARNFSAMFWWKLKQKKKG